LNSKVQYSLLHLTKALSENKRSNLLIIVNFFGAVSLKGDHMISQRVFTVQSIIVLLFLTSCGGGDGGGGGAQPTGLTITKGEFLDSAVEGLEFAHSNGQSGLTDANGAYSYGAGTIEFFIGDISLGSAPAEFLMSPVNLAGASTTTNQTATNIARFLQVLDDDSNPSNGIRISQQVRDLAVNESVIFDDANFDTNVQSVVDKLTAGTRNIASVSNQTAQTHLDNTLLSVRTNLIGEYTGTATSTFSDCPSSAVDSISNGSVTVDSASSTNFAASGSFSASVRGINVREDFTMYGVVNIDGTISGSLDSEAYQDGEYAGSGSASFEGKYNSSALQFKTPPQSLDYIQEGCVHNGTLIVVAR
jgi:hypothetical protein